MTVPTKKEIMDFSPINRGEKEELPDFKRNSYSEIEKTLKTGLITAITGLRRVGKSTLIKQLLRKNGFYFSFDEKKYANPESLKYVIEAFIQEKEKPLIALDEVFRVEDWAGAIKKYHDQKLAKFIVSGSSSLTIKKGIESLSGRLFEHYIPPLQFDEYLRMKGKNIKKINSTDLFRTKDRFQEETSNFFINGSFPEIVKMDNKTSLEYIKTSTIEKIVFDDIPSIFKIEYPSKLYDLLKLCATNSSRLFTDINLAEALQISRHTVSDYLLYLNKAYLIDILFPQGSLQKAYKKQKKIFVKSASIYTALADNSNIGQTAETSVYDKLHSKKLKFYTDSQKREVDFILDSPLEVKYQSTITSEDIKNSLYYAKKYKKRKCIIITRDLFDEKIVEGINIFYIPLDVFLLLDLEDSSTII